jgi:hypothetical protein
LCLSRKSKYISTYGKRGFNDLDTLSDLCFTIAVKADVLSISQHTALQLIRSKPIVEPNKAYIPVFEDAVI